MRKWLVVVLMLLLFGVPVLLYNWVAGRAGPTSPEVTTNEAPEVMEPAEKLAPDVEAMAAKQQALELELAAARRELTDLRLNTTAEPVPEVATNSAPDRPASFMDSLSSMMESPDMRDMMKTQSRMALAQSHGEFFRGIDPRLLFQAALARTIV